MDKWFHRISRPSPKVTNLKNELMKLKPEHLDILNNLMNRITNDCPNLEILPVGGYSPYGFHIKIKGQISADRFSVYAMIIPYKTKGIRVKTRRQIDTSWNRIVENGQRLFEKIVSTSEDIERFIIYCRGLQ